MKRFDKKAEAFIITNGYKVRPVLIISIDGGMYTLVFRDGSGVTRVNKKRLYYTKEEAEAAVKAAKSPRSTWGMNNKRWKMSG